MSSKFRSKAQHFADQVISEVTASAEPSQGPQPAAVEQPQGGESVSANEPHAYREENRHSEFGTKHIDPDTGLIYFKYDFGYEFGLVLPGEPQKVDKIESSIGKEGTIELPVLHEQTAKAEAAKPAEKSEQLSRKNSKEIPSFKPKKFSQFKTSKWEPNTDSEMSDHEAIGKTGGPSRYYEERKQSYNKFQPVRAECSPSPQSIASISPNIFPPAAIKPPDGDPSSSASGMLTKTAAPVKKGEK